MSKVKEMEPFKLLLTKEMASIFIGDVRFGDGFFEQSVSLPYQRGTDICEIAQFFGLPMIYGDGIGAQSRWSLMKDLLEYAINNDRISDLLCYLFAKERFVDTLKGLSPTNIDENYAMIVDTVIEQINSRLHFGGQELRKVGKRFIMAKTGDKVELDTPIIKQLDRDYINSIKDRAYEDIQRKDFDSSLTKARTMLEEVFVYIIEQSNQGPNKKSIGMLYSQVKTILNMHQDKNVDKRINDLLNGFEKILTSIADMRNANSDSHGVGSKRIAIDDYHARLYVNAATAFAEFILSSFAKQKAVAK